jgi:hypothetical protein
VAIRRCCSRQPERLALVGDDRNRPLGWRVEIPAGHCHDLFGGFMALQLGHIDLPEARRQYDKAVEHRG